MIELLGDAIFGTLLWQIFCVEFPNSDEGQLTRIKSKIVNRKSLSSIVLIQDKSSFRL